MTYPTTSSASDVWSLRDVYKAEAGGEWPFPVPIAPDTVTAEAGNTEATVTFSGQVTYGDSPTFTVTSSPGGITATGSSPVTVTGLTNGTEYTFTVTVTDNGGQTATSSASNAVTPAGLYTDATYGTLVGAFEGDWQPTAVSVTEGQPTPSSSNVILSDSDFQTVRSNASSGLVYYVWGSSLENYAAYNRSDIESANVSPAPQTTINPNNFGIFGDPTTGYRVHFHEEITGSSLTGSDYSVILYRDTNTLGVLDFASVKSVDSTAMNTAVTTSKLYIFYK